MVSGAGSGIGRHVLQRLAQERPGDTIYGLVRSRAQVQELEATAGNVRALVADLTDEASLTAAIAAVEASGLPLVGLFDSAGLPIPNVPVELIDVAEMRRVYDVDVFGLVLLIQRAIPLMRKAGGARIALLGSVTGAVTPAFMGMDAARAIEAVADALRREVKAFSIGVSVVQAGFVASPVIAKTESLDKGLQQQHGQALAPYPKLSSKEYGEQVAVKDMAPMSDVSDVVLHAFSTRRPKIRYVVGATPVLPAPLLVWVLNHLPHHVIDLLE